MFPENRAEMLAVCRLISLAKMNAIGISGFAPIEDRDAWQELIETYSVKANEDEESSFDLISAAQDVMEASIKRKGEIDFDDMVYFPLYFNAKLPDLDFLCFDEAQDATPLMIEFLNRMGKNGCRIVIVGDTRQAINSFMGSKVNAIQYLAEKLQMNVFPLPVSYRCSKIAAKMANEVFPDSVIPNESANEGVYNEIMFEEFSGIITGLQHGDLVLSRTHKNLIPPALGFIKRLVPFKYKGKKK